MLQQVLIVWFLKKNQFTNIKYVTMIKIISILSVTLIVSLFNSNYISGDEEEEEKIITFSCGDGLCKDSENRCTLDKPAYMLDGVCVKEGIVIDSLTEGAIKAISCSCVGCGMHLYGTDNIDDMETYLEVVGDYWIDDAVWKQLSEKVLLKTGNQAFDVVKIESIITNEIFTSLKFTYITNNGVEETATIPMNVEL